MSEELRRELDRLRVFFAGVALVDDADCVRYAREQLRDLARAEARHVKAIGRARDALEKAAAP